MNSMKEYPLVPRWLSWLMLIFGIGFVVIGFMAGPWTLASVATPAGIMVGLGLGSLLDRVIR